MLKRSQKSIATRIIMMNIARNAYYYYKTLRNNYTSNVHV
jgi:hypothetical protein